jgi:cell shape-determining protein MreD
MIKYFYYLIISFCLVFIVQSFFSALGFLSNLNVLLVFIAFILIVWGFNLSFVFAIFIGLFLNIYSYLPFGTFILIYLLILFCVNFLYKNIFINFSLVTSLILIILSTICYEFLLLILNFIFYLVDLVNIYIILDKAFFFNLLWQIALNSLLMAFIFILGQVTTKKLNLTFLIKR